MQISLGYRDPGQRKRGGERWGRKKGGRRQEGRKRKGKKEKGCEGEKWGEKERERGGRGGDSEGERERKWKLVIIPLTSGTSIDRFPQDLETLLKGSLGQGSPGTGPASVWQALVKNFQSLLLSESLTAHLRIKLRMET